MSDTNAQGTGSCCGPAEQEACCTPAEKIICCGTVGGTCGCQ